VTRQWSCSPRGNSFQVRTYSYRCSSVDPGCCRSCQASIGLPPQHRPGSTTPTGMAAQVPRACCPDCSRTLQWRCTRRCKTMLRAHMPSHSSPPRRTCGHLRHPCSSSPVHTVRPGSRRWTQLGNSTPPKPYTALCTRTSSGAAWHHMNPRGTSSRRSSFQDRSSRWRTPRRGRG
jgi:hypothetical protein